MRDRCERAGQDGEWERWTAPPTRECVVLVHGLFFNGWELLPLARRLRCYGFAPVRFSYPTVAANPEANGRALAAFAQRLDHANVHFVGHSLGGIVIRHALAVAPDLPPGRVVTLGTPHAGAAVVGTVNRLAAGRALLRQASQAGLDGGAPALPSARECGGISGDRPAMIGLGAFLPGIPSPGDGMVGVAESADPGLAQRLVLPVSHTGMVFNREVARQIAHFLRHGTFADCPPTG
jgi:pimeloyl-ACP methyl ester carboxylesterase